MKKLIVNADDFGLHDSTNSAIITGYKNGIITSTSIMPSGKAFDDAVSLALSNPALGIGVHLTLVGEAPVLTPDKVPSLVDESGKLPPHYPKFLLQYLSGKLRLEDIKEELYAQVEKVISTGLPISHLDSHQHMHIVPGIIDVVIAIAKEFKISAVRIPAEPYFFFGGYPTSIVRFLGRCGLTFLANQAKKKIINSGLYTSDHFFGMLAGGNMQEKYLANIIRNLPDGISEIMMHPGNDDKTLRFLYNDWTNQWQAELSAATSDSIKTLVKNTGIKLIAFREFVYD